MLATAAAEAASAAVLAWARIAQIIDSIAQAPKLAPLLTIDDCLNCFVRFSVDGVHLQPRIFNNASAFFDRVGHRREQIRLRLNGFAVTLIGDMHRFDHGAIVVAEDRGCGSTHVTRTCARGLANVRCALAAPVHGPGEVSGHNPPRMKSENCRFGFTSPAPPTATTQRPPCSRLRAVPQKRQSPNRKWSCHTDLARGQRTCSRCTAACRLCIAAAFESSNAEDLRAHLATSGSDLPIPKYQT